DSRGSASRDTGTALECPLGRRAPPRSSLRWPGGTRGLLSRRHTGGATPNRPWPSGSVEREVAWFPCCREHSRTCRVPPDDAILLKLGPLPRTFSIPPTVPAR